ncbi:MAG: hypothetical protein WA705_19290 [Candidatus Ozemobacteraceae bacterium]
MKFFALNFGAATVLESAQEFSEPAMEIHANLVQSLMTGRYLYRLPAWAACLMILLFSIGLSAILHRYLFGAFDVLLTIFPAPEYFWGESL